tara:strand:+ start:129 stop:620 length:492 start_codon:yes stop_codon:yes gene_type:complete
MTKPLSEEVAKEYGYKNRPFREWLDNYFESLELEKRKNEIKPIKMRVGDDRYSNLTDEMREYVVQDKSVSETGIIDNLTLNPNYIYIIKPEGSGRSTHYISIENPFDSKTAGAVRNMAGVYKDRVGNHTYTGEGLNIARYTVMAVLKFPSQIEFMNWQTNPLR